jgi:hypothetical protein
MIITTINTEVLFNREPTLDNYLPDGQLDFEAQIMEAKREILQNLKDHHKFVRKYCYPVELQASVAKTTSFTGEWVEDEIERMIFSCKVTEAGGTEILRLQGSNDDGTTVVDIGFLTFEEAGTKYHLFDDTYKKYRVVYAGTSITYSSSLIESSFYLAHLYLSLALCYQLNVSVDNDLWDKKFKYYYQMYETQMNRMLASYDEDDDGTLETDEVNKFTTETRLVR